jgi:hypothetical protein
MSRVRKTGLAKRFLDGQGAARHVAGVLEDGAVARHQRRRRETEDLPEREVPGHDRQHDPDRLEGDEAPGGIRLHGLGREEGAGVVGVEVADPGALVDLRPTLAQGLAHLECHQIRVELGPVPQGPPHRLQQLGALAEGRLTPGEERAVNLVDDPRDGVGRRFFVGINRSAGRGIRALNRHDPPRCRTGRGSW